MKVIATFKTMILFISILTLQSIAQSFQLKSAGSGLEQVTSTAGVAIADYDLDGDLDAYFVNYEQYDPLTQANRSFLMRNNGNQTFSNVIDDANIVDPITRDLFSSGMAHKYGASWGDFDNDGDPDLFLASSPGISSGSNRLYRNEGDGTFTDITFPAGVAGVTVDHHNSALWWDYDVDGDLDLYVSAWVGKNLMYENNGNETFTDVSDASGLATYDRTWTSATIDANNDGLVDIYLVNDFGVNSLMINQGDKTFSNHTSAAGLGDPGNGMGVTVADYDNNGFFDIYLTNIADFNLNPLYTNQGDGTFLENASAMGIADADWAWGTEFFDCDHDGDLDLYVVNGFEDNNTVSADNNHFFENISETGTLGFIDISEATTTNSPDEARGLAVFDYDADGDLDLLVSNIRAAPHLYANESMSGNWLQVSLEGSVSNRNAFGTVLKLTANGNVYHRYYTGMQHLAQNIMPVHFGVAEATIIDELVITWPTGDSETFTDIAANQVVHILEGTGIVSDIGETTAPIFPGEFTLHGNFPNPFNGRTFIEIETAAGGAVEVVIYNVLGQEVNRLSESISGAGIHRIAWDGTDISGQSGHSGLYFYAVRMGDQQRHGQLLYIK